MTQPNGTGNDANESRLPRRDWVLLPMVGLLTIFILAGSTELIARLMFTDSSTDKEGCIVRNDPSTGWRGIPNCVNFGKTYEGEPAVFRFNSSGFRNDFEFAPKQPGTYRIVMLGSSAVQGGGVKEEDTIAALLPAELSAKTGRRVEIYNEGIEGWGGTPRNIASRFSKALSVQPDLVLWILTSWDIRNAAGMMPHDEILPDETRLYPDAKAPAPGAPTDSLGNGGILTVAARALTSVRGFVSTAWHNSRSDLMLVHFMVELESQNQFVRSQNLSQDAQYLGAQPSEKRLQHLQELDRYVAEIHREASDAGVPVAVVFWPNATYAAVISLDEWPAGIDPFSLDNELRSVFVNRGVIYIDVLPDYRNILNPEEGYFPYDGHPNANGDLTFSGLLAKELANGGIPELKATVQSRPPQGARKITVDTASFHFVLFGLAVALVSNLSRSPVWRSIVLMAASLVFLGLLSHNPVVFLPLAGFLLFGYGGLMLIERGWSRPFVWILLAVIFVFVWLKKYTFLPHGIFLQFPYFTLGLSYIFFRVLHLLIETGDNREKQHIGLGAYLLYTLNFTTLVSGPIQRYDEFARDQFTTRPIVLGIRTIGLQLERIVRGFFKVNVLAMLLHTVQEDALTQLLHPFSPHSVKLYAAFKLAVVFPLFVYSNFSGYIDIVIAMARLMRVRLPENFDRPFSATSFIDFWNRWHITLSTWLKTYVYNPLLVALMRRITSLALQPFLGVFCFFVTFFLIGVWHGRTAEFVFYGVLQGAGMSVNKLWQLGLTRAVGRKGYKALASNPVYDAMGRGITFSWFAFTLFWFWADWKEIDRISMSIGVMQWLGVLLAIWLSATVVLAVWEWLRTALLSIKTSGGPVLTSRYARVVYASALGLAAFVVTILLNQPAPDVVYKAF